MNKNAVILTVFVLFVFLSGAMLLLFKSGRLPGFNQEKPPQEGALERIGVENDGADAQAVDLVGVPHAGQTNRDSSPTPPDTLPPASENTLSDSTRRNLQRIIEADRVYSTAQETPRIRVRAPLPSEVSPQLPEKPTVKPPSTAQPAQKAALPQRAYPPLPPLSNKNAQKGVVVGRIENQPAQ